MQQTGRFMPSLFTKSYKFIALNLSDRETRQWQGMGALQRRLKGALSYGESLAIFQFLGIAS